MEGTESTSCTPTPFQLPHLACTDYISNQHLLPSLVDAGGQLMYAYKDMLELAGLSSQLYTLFATLHTLRPLPEFVCSTWHSHTCRLRCRTGGCTSSVPCNWTCQWPQCQTGTLSL